MTGWMADERLRARNAIALVLGLGWIAGGVAAWQLFHDAADPGADLHRVAVGIVLTVVVGAWVSWTFVTALFRRLYGWQWRAIDLSKYDYGRHREMARTPQRRPASKASNASQSRLKRSIR